jgi:hypothetical protein
VGEGGRALVQHHLPAAVAAVVCIALGVYSTREAAVLLRSELQRRLGRPSLVRETTQRSWLVAAAAALLRTLCCRGADARVQRADAFADVVLRGELADTLRELAVSSRCVCESASVFVRVRACERECRSRCVRTDDREHCALRGLRPLRRDVVRTLSRDRNARRNGAPLRHVMFYGPPGTGKTMVAQRLALHCGLDYAMMSGGDVVSRAVATAAPLCPSRRSTRLTPLAPAVHSHPPRS